MYKQGYIRNKDTWWSNTNAWKTHTKCGKIHTGLWGSANGKKWRKEEKKPWKGAYGTRRNDEEERGNTETSDTKRTWKSWWYDSLCKHIGWSLERSEDPRDTKERIILRTPRIYGKPEYVWGYTGSLRKVQKRGWKNWGKG